MQQHQQQQQQQQQEDFRAPAEAAPAGHASLTFLLDTADPNGFTAALRRLGEKDARTLQQLSRARWQDWQPPPAEEDLQAIAISGRMLAEMRSGRFTTAEQLLAALTNGMQQLGCQQLLPQDLQQHAGRFGLLARLWYALGGGWKGSWPHQPYGLTEAKTQHASIQLPVLATRAGLFSALGCSCATLAGVINQHAAADQQQATADATDQQQATADATDQQQATADATDQQQATAEATDQQQATTAAAGAAAADQEQGLGQQQQQPQNQQQPSIVLEESGAAGLAAQLLVCAAMLADAWPGGSGLTSPAFAPALPGLIELALAVIRNTTAALCPCTTHYESARNGALGLVNPLQAALVFSWCLAACCGSTRGTAQLAGNAAAAELLLLCLGLTAQLQHELSGGLLAAAVEQQQQQQQQQREEQEAEQQQQQEREQLQGVEPYHQQLLLALGLSGLSRASGLRGFQCDAQTLLGCVWGVLDDFMIIVRGADPTWLCGVMSYSSSSSSSSAVDSSPPLVQQQASQQPTELEKAAAAATAAAGKASAPLVVAMLLVLVECTALLPATGRVVSQGCAAVDAVLLWQWSTVDTQLHHPLMQFALPALFRLVLPAAKQAAASRKPAASADARQEQLVHQEIGLEMLEQGLPHLVMGLTKLVISSQGRSPAAVAAAAAALEEQHTEVFAALLEAALRHTSQQELLDSSRIGAANVADLFQATAGTALLLPGRGQQQLFALLLSCLKALVLGPGPDSSSGDGTSGSTSVSYDCLSLVAAGNIMCQLTQVLGGSGSSSGSGSNAGSDNSSSSSAAANADTAGHCSSGGCGQDRLLPVVLLARSLAAVGLLYGRLQQLPPAVLQDEQETLQVMCDAPDKFLDAVRQLAQELQQLSAAQPQQLPPPALQQLTDEHLQPLTASLEEVIAASLTTFSRATEDGSSSAADREAARTQAAATARAVPAEQLVALGAAAAALLPLQLCCNHHSCSNFGRVSELQLVGGPTCVCGGCQVARYCSRECQVAHYKGWHKAVCKRIQLQRGGSQQQQAQQQS